MGGTVLFVDTVLLSTVTKSDLFSVFNLSSGLVDCFSTVRLAFVFRLFYYCESTLHYVRVFMILLN